MNENDILSSIEEKSEHQLSLEEKIGRLETKLSEKELETEKLKFDNKILQDVIAHLE